MALPSRRSPILSRISRSTVSASGMRSSASARHISATPSCEDSAYSWRNASMPPLPSRSRRTASTSRRAVAAMRSRAAAGIVGGGEDRASAAALVAPVGFANRGAQRRRRAAAGCRKREPCRGSLSPPPLLAPDSANPSISETRRRDRQCRCLRGCVIPGGRSDQLIAAATKLEPDNALRRKKPRRALPHRPGSPTRCRLARPAAGRTARLSGHLIATRRIFEYDAASSSTSPAAARAALFRYGAAVLFGAGPEAAERFAALTLPPPRLRAPSRCRNARRCAS